MVIMMATPVYEGEATVLGILDKMKLYRARCDTLPLSKEEAYQRSEVLEQHDVTKSPGFALIWRPDVMVARVRKDSRGFDLSVFDNETQTETEGWRRVCYVDSSVLGTESYGLLKSQTIEEYLNHFYVRTDLQSTFRKEHGFNL